MSTPRKAWAADVWESNTPTEPSDIPVLAFATEDDRDAALRDLRAMAALERERISVSWNGEEWLAVGRRGHAHGVDPAEAILNLAALEDDHGQ